MLIFQKHLREHSSWHRLGQAGHSERKVCRCGYMPNVTRPPRPLLPLLHSSRIVAEPVSREGRWGLVSRLLHPG